MTFLPQRQRRRRPSVAAAANKLATRRQQSASRNGWSNVADVAVCNYDNDEAAEAEEAKANDVAVGTNDEVAASAVEDADVGREICADVEHTGNVGDKAVNWNGGRRNCRHPNAVDNDHHLLANVEADNVAVVAVAYDDFD